jgi:ATP-binding cassette subfamily C (CFTR/MRP) protein 4
MYHYGDDGTVVCRMTQPLFLGGLIHYFSPGSDTSHSTAFVYAVCIIVCSSVAVVVKQAYMLAMFHTGMKMRVGICSLLYRKASICCSHVI